MYRSPYVRLVDADLLLKILFEALIFYNVLNFCYVHYLKPQYVAITYTVEL